MDGRFTTYFGEDKELELEITGEYSTYDDAVKAILEKHRVEESGNYIYEIRDNEENISTYMEVGKKGMSVYSVVD